MANSASDHAPQAAPTLATGMQDGAVQQTENATRTVPAAHGSRYLQQGSPLASRRSGTRVDILPPGNSQPISARLPNPIGNLTHQAALQCVNARITAAATTTSPPPKSAPTTQATTTSEPVLVHAAPRSPIAMKKSSKTRGQPRSSHGQDSDNSTIPPPPPPESFTFPSILASLDPTATASIDAIAEICGRSKFSLADEHAAHLPPHGEVEALPIARMETLDESRRDGVHTRAMARRLALANNNKTGGGARGAGGRGETMTAAARGPGSGPGISAGQPATGLYSSDATAATSSVVISHAPSPPTSSSTRPEDNNNRMRRPRRKSSTTAGAGAGAPISTSAILPQQVWAWLRGSSSLMTTASEEEQEVDAAAGTGAAGRLARLLNE